LNKTDNNIYSKESQSGYENQGKVDDDIDVKLNAKNSIVLDDDDDSKYNELDDSVNAIMK